MEYSTPSHMAARAIRIHLAARDETIEQLSEAIGLAHSTLKRRLLGVSPFNVNELHLIAGHFDVTIADVLKSPFEANVIAA